jgi:hypothetical protein
LAFFKREVTTGKRSEFRRIERDAYNTPAVAAEPLLRNLAHATRFLEPCVGAGYLVEHLTGAGHVLVGAHDLPDDARSHHYGVEPGALFISNPPFWGRPFDLHPLIADLSDQAPTWLLMPGDWLFNRSSAPLMPRLRRIVAVGRARWIPDSRFTGKDNACWLLFDRPDTRAEIVFIGRESRTRNGRALGTNAPTPGFSRDSVKALPAGLERAAGSEVLAS